LSFQVKELNAWFFSRKRKIKKEPRMRMVVDVRTILLCRESFTLVLFNSPLPALTASPMTKKPKPPRMIRCAMTRLMKTSPLKSIKLLLYTENPALQKPETAWKRLEKRALGHA
jgi:hypothetical protein